ncbi:unnamed protein product [Caenorhabditis bovis]|uniref:Serpin domain-containing protein n=1 Tax=Caenorhabditis bovis TaxID=2654633 RepID=A0A8S1ECK4_9PELO|nr:unnamed protein product [Caenorhabditis bovis]
MFLEAETAFGLNLLNTFPANESLVFSPLSIALALSLVHAGAKGDTRTQIGDTLLKGSKDDELAGHFSKIGNDLKNPTNSDVQTNVANRIFLKNGFTVEKSYSEFVEKHFAADAQTIDFTNGAEAAKIVNEFIKKNTGNKIDNVVQSSTFQDALALLVNAIYFKAKWREEFTKSGAEREFSKSTNDVKKIPFMSSYMEDQDYAEDDIFQVLSLPYKDTSYRCLFFLPKEKHGLASALKKLDDKRFQELAGKTKTTYATVHLPKVDLKKELELVPILEQLGINDVFSNNADLSGMAKGVKISDVIHHAVIKIDEEGTTAAAAVVVKAVPMMARMEEPVDFIADHPFLFAVVKDNHPLFLGTFFG